MRNYVRRINWSGVDVAQVITDRVARGLPRLSAEERAWVKAHLVDPPRLVELSAEPDGSKPVVVWLVTDHTGDSDDGNRVVFDPASGSFGLATTLLGGVEWYMGPFAGDFADVLEAM